MEGGIEGSRRTELIRRSVVQGVWSHSEEEDYAITIQYGASSTGALPPVFPFTFMHLPSRVQELHHAGPHGITKANQTRTVG